MRGLMIAYGVDQLFLRHVGTALDANILRLVLKLVLGPILKMRAVVIEGAFGFRA